MYVEMLRLAYIYNQRKFWWRGAGSPPWIILQAEFASNLPPICAQLCPQIYLHLASTLPPIYLHFASSLPPIHLHFTSTGPFAGLQLVLHTPLGNSSLSRLRRGVRGYGDHASLGRYFADSRCLKAVFRLFSGLFSGCFDAYSFCFNAD